MDVTFRDNSAAVLAAFERAKGKALAMIGLKADEIQAMEISIQPRFGGGSGMGAVDTGLMRASVGHQVNQQNSEVIVGNSADYAIYVTMGTWKMPKRPFLQNTLLNYGDDYRDMVEQAFSGM